MIYLSDDYLTKYSDTLSYLISRSYSEGYSFDFIQKTIAYSKAISELERSNITSIAFSSFEKVYSETFPKNNNDFSFNAYDMFGWSGYAYMHLFLKLRITFEALFYLIPLEEMFQLYHLYHEMSITQLEEYASNQLKFTMLDIIMKSSNISTQALSKMTDLSASTINALRYKKRDIAKLEASKLSRIALALNVKMETLLPSIYLECQ